MASAKRPTPLPVPGPVATRTVCSECGLDWDTHPEQATLADCVRLLRAKLECPAPVLPWVGIQSWCSVCGQGYVGHHSCAGRQWFSWPTTYWSNTADWGTASVVSSGPDDDGLAGVPAVVA